MPDPTPLYPLWPRQQEAMRLLGIGGYQTDELVDELLFGGAAGGGKSFYLRGLGVGLCLSVPNLVISLFRRTYPQLEDTHIPKIRAELPEAAGKYNAERHQWQFPNGSVLQFRYCEKEGDVFNYNSAEWDALFIDEATQMTEPMIRYLRSRVRSTKPNWRPIIVYTANPGGVGHLYFKKGFVDAAPPGRVFQAPPDDGGLRRAFLPARLEDNPALPASYRKMLDGIADPALRKALRDGDWNIFAGQVFGEFRYNTHVCEEFAIPPHWRRWRGYDWGYSSPMACVWLAKNPDTKRIYIYREMYDTKLTDVEQARRIKKLSQGERIDYTAADPAVFKREGNGLSIASVFAQNGVPLIRANNDRRSGWQRVHEYLDPRDGPPKLQIFETCTNLIRTLPSLTFDAHRVEDVNSDEEDHLADSLRYSLLAAKSSASLRVVVSDFQVVA